MTLDQLRQPDEEATLLGTILDDPVAIKNVVDILRPEHFYREFFRDVYEACLSLYRDGTDISTSGAIDRYLRLGSRNFPGIRSAIIALTDKSLPTPSLARNSAVNLIDLYKRRQATVVYKTGLNDLEDLSKPINSTLASSTEQLFALSSDELGEGVSSLGHEALPEALRRLEAARNGQGDVGVVPYEWRSLTALSPLRRGEVTVVCGRPGMAKTSLALNTALFAAKQNIPVGIFSLEMNKASLALRLISLVSGVDSRLIEKGKTSEEEHTLVLDAIKKLSELPIHIDDSAELDEIAFMNKSRTACSKHGLGLIILDYLTLMTRRSGQDDVSAVGSCARTVRKTARILQVPIIEVCQVSRSCEYREDKRPRLSDLRESGEIEQEADIVLALYRDEYYNKTTTDKFCEVNVLKHRNGPLGMVKLVFLEKTTKFAEVHPMFYGSSI